MPHLILQHSMNVDTGEEICEALFQVLAEHEAIPHPDSLKIRTIPCPDWRLGTEPQSFAHADLLLLPGRDTATKQSLSRTVLDVMQVHLPQVGSLSVDVKDLSDAYIKRVL